MNKTTKIIIGVVVIILIIGGIWYWANRKPEEQKVIKIGFMGPLTGELANYGESLRNGVNLALEEINRNGINKKRLKVVFEDTQCDPAKAVSAINKLITIDKVEAIIGDFCSSCTLAVASIAEANRVVLISPASSAPTISEAGDYIFRTVLSDAYQAKIAAQYVIKKNYKRISVLYVNNDWGVGLKESFRKEIILNNGDIITIESIQQGATDLKTQLIKLKSKNPDVIYVAILPPEVIRFAKQQKELGIITPIIGADSFQDKEVLKEVGNLLEGVVFASGEGQATKDYLQKYKEKYGSEPTMYSDSAYDAAKILAMVMKEGNIKGSEIKDALYQIKDYEGASGTITFDKNGDVEKPIIIKTIKNGQFVPYEE